MELAFFSLPCLFLLGFVVLMITILFFIIRRTIVTFKETKEILNRKSTTEFQLKSSKKVVVDGLIAELKSFERKIENSLEQLAK